MQLFVIRRAKFAMRLSTDSTSLFNTYILFLFKGVTYTAVQGLNTLELKILFNCSNRTLLFKY